MGLRFTSDETVTALYDSVSGWAFGPTFGSSEAAERFLKWCERQGVANGDVRVLDLAELERLWDRYCEEVGDPDE